MHLELIFRDIDKHPGYAVPDVTSALCDIKPDKVFLLPYRTPPGIHSLWCHLHTVPLLPVSLLIFVSILSSSVQFPFHSVQGAEKTMCGNSRPHKR